jgi:tripartite-type tricarboxylate transporter receptor subunit TctC
MAAAQPVSNDWPSRPITVIVPFPAGSATDLIARVVTKELGGRLRTPVVIENRPGGDTTIGTRALARSRPDGYTLGFAGLTATAIAPSTHRALGYNPEADLAPVSLIGRIPYVLVVSPKLGVTNVSEFIALAKAKPHEINYASAGEVSLANLGMLILAGKSGIELTHVPYKSTAHQSLTFHPGSSTRKSPRSLRCWNCSARGKCVLLPLLANGARQRCLTFRPWLKRA